MPDDWSNVVHKDKKDEFYKVDYSSMACISWGAIQYMMSEIRNLKAHITKLKNKMKNIDDWFKFIIKYTI